MAEIVASGPYRLLTSGAIYHRFRSQDTRGTRNAEKAIGKLSRASAKSESGCCCYVAGIYAALGNKDQALRWLERGYAEREYAPALLKVDRLMDRLRDDPRFASLLERMAFGNTANRETLESSL